MPDLQAELMAIYEATSQELTPESPFGHFGPARWSWPYRADRQKLEGLMPYKGGLNAKALVAAYRIGLPVKPSRERFSVLLAEVGADTGLRFALLMTAYGKLRAVGMLALLRAENPALYANQHHLNALASLEYFLTLAVEGAAGGHAFARWGISDDFKAFTECLTDTAAMEEDPEAAIDAMVAATAGLKRRLPPFFEPAWLVRPLAHMRAAAEASAETISAPDFGLCTYEAAGQPVILVNADRVYFERYGTQFLRSCGQRADRPLVHVNLVNHRLDRAAVRALEAEAGVRLNVSQETFEGTRHEVAALAALSRFIHLPHYLARYGLVAILDIDGEAAFDMAALRAVPQGAVALHQPSLEGVNQITFLWKNFHAGRCVFHAPPADAIAALSGFIARAFLAARATGTPLWHLDQVALALWSRAFPALEVHPAPPLFIQRK